MTVASFDPAVAAELAARGIRERLIEVVQTAEAQTAKALEQVEGYARHLDAGGDPREGFDPLDRFSERNVLVRAQPGLRAVYEAWNKARGSRNPFSPIDGRRNWEIAEYILERVGSPVLYETFQHVLTGADRFGFSVQSEDVAKALCACQGDDLVVRRTKIDGKVAYLLRERKEGDEPAGRRSEDGRWYVDVTKIPQERWTPTA